MNRPTNCIQNLLSLNPTVGDIGVEIEMEGSSEFPVFGSSADWRKEHDGSLRGHSAEYVFRKPLSLEKAKKAVTKLKSTLDNNGNKIIYSERAGVHVHVNCQHMTVEQVIRYASLYYCFETVLTKFCGEWREGNHFCLRLQDAEAILFTLLQVTRQSKILKVNNDIYRYAALNFRSLGMYGSLEFRAMETQPDLSKINEWCDMLVAIREYAINNINSREDIAARMSFIGPEAFLAEVVGQDNFKLLEYQGMDRDILIGMREVQLLLHAPEVTQ